MPMNTLVIHGSVLRPLAKPRDIDVIFSKSFGAEEEALVRAWAERRGLPDDLPIDAKKSGGKFAVRVPRAAYAQAPYEVLSGDAEVVVVSHHSLPAMIRACGDRPFDLRDVLEGKANRGGGYRLCIHDKAADAEMGDWTGYTQGLAALKSAIEHAPAWADAGPVAQHLSALAERGASLDALKALTRGSPWAAGGAAVVVAVREDGLHAIHGDGFVPWEKAIWPENWTHSDANAEE